MRAPDHPKNPERLAALYSYNILDTERDRDFDDLVKLASKLCGTTMSVISLVDADRQWFKAEIGVGMPGSDLESAICGHAILGGDFLELPDTLIDDRTADNPFCTGDFGLRFYAGATLRTEDGLPLGTLCVLDRKPMHLSDDQREALWILARQVTARLDLHRALQTEAMLRLEVDHRVKNSLQTIASLMRLQARSATEETRAALDIAQNRITTIGTLHDLLSGAGAQGQIDLKPYITQICAQLTAAKPDNVVIAADIAPVLVGSRMASSLGIIINEFATNSLKHAFPGEREGHLQFTMAAPQNGVARLICQDDGVGLSEAKSDRVGLGLQIVQSMASRIEAVAETVSGPSGTKTTLTFKPQ